MAVPAREKLEVCILAGGLSTRMGRDKTRLKIGSMAMVTRVRKGAAAALPATLVRVIRKDIVSRCGPLGGIATALKTSRAKTVLFLACDMPLVSPALLRRMVRSNRGGECAVFAEQNKRVGFPCALPVQALAVVQQQIDAKEFSLQALAAKLHARRLLIPARSLELLNVNTPADLAEAGRALLPKTR